MQLPPATLLCNYRYDPLDRVIVNALANEPERQLFYLKNRLATEIHGTVGYSIVQVDDQLLAQQRIEGGARETSLLATDQQRSVSQTLPANRPPQCFTYSPYGYAAQLVGLPSLLGFNGERPDPLTGHYLLGNGYRAFNSVLMRFNSSDSWSPFGEGGLNTYAYCSGNPINLLDPSGHSPLTKLFNWIGRKLSVTNKKGDPSKKFNAFANPKPGQYDYVGMHGSSSMHVKSLENGLNPKFMGAKNGQIHGPGFYVTENLSYANRWAHSTPFKSDSPMIFDVFLRRPETVSQTQQGMQVGPKAGIDYAGSSEHFVISPSRYEDVVVKARDVRRDRNSRKTNRSKLFA